MVLWASILFLQGAGFAATSNKKCRYPSLAESLAESLAKSLRNCGSMTSGIPGVPENITVMFLNPTSVRVSWSTSQVDQVEKYDVTYKPTDASNDERDSLSLLYPRMEKAKLESQRQGVSYRVVAVVAGNSEAVTLSGLRADTQYQLVVTAVRAGKKYRSRPIVFRTLEPPRTFPQQDAAVTNGPIPPSPPSSQQPQPYIQIRGVEVGIVILVLIVWAGAIALFFNRWGKIRMLLPYQPDYKEQLKVPGTGVCSAANTAYPQHSTQHACSQHQHWSSHHVDSLDSGSGLGWPRPTRPRVNSAIDVAGFLSQEFLRRHGSTSKLCRKVRSADNLPLASANRPTHQRRDSRCEGNEGDRESFLKPTLEDQERYEAMSPKRQGSPEYCSKETTETSLVESSYQQPFSRDSPIAPTSLVAKRFSGWRVAGSHEYVRCPAQQPVSMDERCYRRSCDPETGLLSRHHHHRHHHHHRLDGEHHSKSCDYARRTPESSIDVKHFGLPILSVSEPSPPDEDGRVDDYL